MDDVTGFGESVYSGACDGPVNDTCGEHHRKVIDESELGDAPFIRYRCPECGTITVLDKKQL